MQFKLGMSVYSSDEQELGRIDRVVLDPETKEVTHLILRQGFLFTEDKVLPIQYVARSTDDAVVLYARADELELPRYEETHYLSADELVEHPERMNSADYVPSLVWYPPVGVAWWGYPEYAGYPPVGAGQVVVERNIPDYAVALKKGAKVISANGDHVGDVERVYMDASTDRATHLVISQGLLFKTRKLVPTSWVAKTAESQVELKMRTQALDNLPEYEE
jgi:uncharacterized protein YrrD